MDKNLTNLLISEFKTATSYLERVIHAITYFSDIWQKKEYMDSSSEIYFDINEIIESKLLADNFSGGTELPVSSKELSSYLNRANTLVEMILKLDFNQLEVKKFAVKYINLLYHHAYNLHRLCNKYSEIKIDYPRINLTTVSKQKIGNQHLNLIKNESLPHQFTLDHEVFDELKDGSGGSILSLDWQRDKKYEQFTREGHEAVYEKKYDQALKNFQKALNYKESAETLNLIGWCHHLMGDNETAKKYCLKSINKDSDYGPPYNDLGNYLLLEGNVEEGLKWFELAKKATHYQNREYPYVNAGRAYMSKKNFEQALEEFSKALTLAPFNEELHATVTKLKQSIEKAKRQQNRINI